MLHILQWLYTNVASVCSYCFICVFEHMLQVYLSGCCICFTYMLQVFYLDVAYVCNSFMCFQVFLQVFQMHILSVSSIFIRMLQMLYLDVSKVNWVLHLPSCLLLPHLSASAPSAALYPSQTAEGARRRLEEGVRRGWRRGRERVLSPSLLSKQDRISVRLQFF
jgi:hypothetical protein